MKSCDWAKSGAALSMSARRKRRIVRSIRTSVETRHYESDIVFEFIGRGEAPDIAVDRVIDRVEVGVAMVLHQVRDAIDRVKLPAGGPSIGESVGVDKQCIA